jgi:hypothetical protein
MLANLVGITNLCNKIAMVGHSQNAMWIIEIHVMNMWSDNKVCELIAVKVLHTSLLNITVIAIKILPLGSYAPMRVPISPFKTILELVL